jgi:hypothetical protein
VGGIKKPRSRLGVWQSPDRTEGAITRATAVRENCTFQHRSDRQLREFCVSCHDYQVVITNDEAGQTIYKRQEARRDWFSYPDP